MTQKKILIVDDDERNIFALHAVLKSKNYECISKTNGRDAFTLLKSNAEVDIVFMDMMMPEMDGYETIVAIKKIISRRSTPIISVTAQVMLGDHEKCMAAGADGYLSKPVDVDLLFKLLSQYN